METQSIKYSAKVEIRAISSPYIQSLVNETTNDMIKQICQPRVSSTLVLLETLLFLKDRNKIANTSDYAFLITMKVSILEVIECIDCKKLREHPVNVCFNDIALIQFHQLVRKPNSPRYGAYYSIGSGLLHIQRGI